MVKISVIILIYNVKNYIKECIESVQNQTLQDLEIICIDDCSTDGSRDIVQEKKLSDPRIQLIQNDTNRGCLYTRKAGVQTATGNYIMFLDGDDWYRQDACEIAYREIEKSGTDILQFGMKVINKGNGPESDYNWFRQFVKSYEHRLDGDEVIRACFKDNLYNYNLVNKIYKRELCQKAFSKLDNGNYCMAEDMLGYFVIAHFANSYIGIQDKLYMYNFAIGISKPGALYIDGFKKRCASSNAVASLKYFLNKENLFSKYEEYYNIIKHKMLWDNLDSYLFRIEKKDEEEALAVLVQSWGIEEVTHMMTEELQIKTKMIQDRELAYERLLHSKSYRLGRKITTFPRIVRDIFKKGKNSE